MELVGEDAAGGPEVPLPVDHPISDLPRPIAALLAEAARRGASDVLLVPGSPAAIRARGARRRRRGAPAGSSRARPPPETSLATPNRPTC
jgi:hypothetical protein